MKKTKLLLGAVYAASLMSISAPASAACDGCVVAAVKGASAAIVASVGTVTASVNAGTLAIVAAISGNAQTVSTAQTRAAEMVVQGTARSQNSVEVARQEDRFVLADGCAVMASTRGVADASRSSAGLGGAGRSGGSGAGAVKGVSREMSRALGIAAGNEPAPSPEVQAALAVPGACGSFVSSAANPVRAQSCSLAGFSTGSSNGHPDADIRAETIFDGPQRSADPAGFVRRLTIDGDGNERSAVAAYMRNLNTPVDLRQLSKAELQSNNGRQYLMYRDAYEARMSLAEKPMRNQLANITANKDTVPVLEQLLSSPVSGNFARDYLNKAYPNWQRRGVSMNELINLEVSRRYLNRDWHLQMAAMPPEAHVKEQTTMMAFNAYLMARVLDRLDQSALLAGQTTASQVRAEMMPQLIQLHSNASR